MPVPTQSNSSLRLVGSAGLSCSCWPTLLWLCLPSPNLLLCVVLQVCLFDLDYGLPVQVRDTALGIEKEDIPESDVGKEFQLNEQIKRGETESAYGAGAGGGGRSNDMLMHLARTTPYYKVKARRCGGVVLAGCPGRLSKRWHACPRGVCRHKGAIRPS